MTIINTKPHLQLGQQGKGKGKKKKKKPTKPKPYKPQGPLPTQPPNIGGFPGSFGDNPPQNFLPDTVGWEQARNKASGDLYSAGVNYNIANRMIPAQLGLDMARLNTDRGYATRDIDEQMAERGLYTSGIRAQEQQRKVAIPFGRQEQDLAQQAAQAYGSAAGDYGNANYGYNSSLFDALLQRAQDVYNQMPMGVNVGHYQAPDQPKFVPTYAPTGKKRGKK